MTLTTTTNKVQYSGDGSTVALPVTFVFWDSDDLRVIHRSSGGTETVWTRGTQYAVSGGSGATGTVTVSTSPTNYTPAAGETLTIKSNLALTQTTSLPLGGDFPSTSVEQRLDKIVRQVQQQNEAISRTLTAAETDTAPSNIPSATARASKYLAFDASGNPVASAAAAGSAVVSTFMETVLDDTTAAAARTTLGAVGLTGNETIAGDKIFSGATRQTGSYRMEGAVAFNTELAPSQITADQNNYAPSGIGNASRVLLSTDALRSLTGLAFSGANAGQELEIVNTGSFGLKLVAESSSSTAANRFGIPFDHTIPPKGSAFLRYDNTNSRWRVSGATPFRESICIFTHDVSDGTDGGTATTGAWTKLAGLAELKDTDGIGSASSGVMTMQPGVYEVMTWKTATGATAGFRTKIRDTSNSADYCLSMTGRHATANENVIEVGSDEITITAAANFEFQYFAGATGGTTDLGEDDGVTAGAERYAVVKWRRIRPAGG